MNIFPRSVRLVALIAPALLIGACGIEPLIGSAASGEGLDDLPEAAPNVLVGRVAGHPGAAVQLFGPTGQPLSGQDTAASADGTFAFTLPGTTGFEGLRVWVSDEGWAAMGLAPSLPRKDSVLDPEATYPMDAIPAMGELGVRSTTTSLVVLHTSKGAAVDGATLADAAQQVVERLDASDESASVFRDMVARLLAEADGGIATIPPFDPTWRGLPGTSPLDPAFLEIPIDYTGDGDVDATTAPFDEALAAAASALSIDTCTPQGWLRVVFEVQLAEGQLNQNCQTIDPYKWAEPAAGKRVFFTGGVIQKDGGTPVCGQSRPTWCVQEETIDAINQTLGGWVPNELEMYDDGTHSDSTAGDGIHTVSFILPYIPPEQSPDGRGFRIGYKYTFGLPGQTWTDAEEWPGNQRILEIEDVDGDGLVVRFDLFGDETSNKDKSNALTPSNGGCGTNKWNNEAKPSCQADTWENRIDTDGDCIADSPPPAPSVGPATCAEVDALGLPDPVWEP